MLRGSNNMVFRVRVGSEDLKRYKGTLPRLCWNVRNNQHDQVCVGRKSRMSLMISQTIEGQGWYFEPWIQLTSLKKPKCWRWSRQILLRDSMKMPSSSDDIKQKEGWSKRLWEPRIWHKLEIKLVVRDEMIGCGRSTQALIIVRSCSGHKDQVAQLKLAW